MEIVAQAADAPAVAVRALTRTESRDGQQQPDSESIAEQSAKKVLISAVISRFRPRCRAQDRDNG
jgi:hypothetical protein